MTRRLAAGENLLGFLHGKSPNATRKDVCVEEEKAATNQVKADGKTLNQTRKAHARASRDTRKNAQKSSRMNQRQTHRHRVAGGATSLTDAIEKGTVRSDSSLRQIACDVTATADKETKACAKDGKWTVSCREIKKGAAVGEPVFAQTCETDTSVKRAQEEYWDGNEGYVRWTGEMLAKKVERRGFAREVRPGEDVLGIFGKRYAKVEARAGICKDAAADRQGIKLRTVDSGWFTQERKVDACVSTQREPDPRIDRWLATQGGGKTVRDFEARSTPWDAKKGRLVGDTACAGGLAVASPAWYYREGSWSDVTLPEGGLPEVRHCLLPVARAVSAETAQSKRREALGKAAATAAPVIGGIVVAPLAVAGVTAYCLLGGLATCLKAAWK